MNHILHCIQGCSKLHGPADIILMETLLKMADLSHGQNTLYKAQPPSN